jgi:DnaJ-class molecular chaperone
MRDDSCSFMFPLMNPPGAQDVLKIARDSSLDEIKAAFKRTALQVHPDKGGSKDGDGERQPGSG